MNRLEELLYAADFAPDARRERVIWEKVVARKGTVPVAVRIRRPARRIIIFAVAAALLLCGTVFADEIAGLIKTLTAGQVVVDQYEVGTELDDYFIIGGTPAYDRDIISAYLPASGYFTEFWPDTGYFWGQIENPESVLEQAQELLDKTLYVPTFMNHGEWLNHVKVYEVADKYPAVDLWYYGGSNNGRILIINQFFIGEQAVKFNTTANITQATVNGYDAVLTRRNGCYMLSWVQDGILFGMLPDDRYTREELIAVAESFVPMR